MKMEHTQCSETSVIKWISTRLGKWNIHSGPKRRVLSGYPLTCEDGSVPKCRLLSGYPLAYEDGTYTVFRNVAIKKNIVSH
jgi:hypothetical protein